jgi:hypothetical protein
LGRFGRPLAAKLAGGRDTVHVFDDFAPKLTPTFHVYGVTSVAYGSRRPSQTAQDEKTQRLANQQTSPVATPQEEMR